MLDGVLTWAGAARSSPGPSATSWSGPAWPVSSSSTSGTRRCTSAASTGYPRTAEPASRSTSGAWPSRGRTTSPSSSTGGRRWPSPSIERPGSIRRAWRGADTSPCGAAPSSASRTSTSGSPARTAPAWVRTGTGTGPSSPCPTVRCPPRRPSPRPVREASACSPTASSSAVPGRSSRPSGRRGPGAWATSWPRSSASRTRSSAPPAGRPRRPGRARDGQDGRGAAPCRLPALHAPLPARAPGRPRGRAEPPVPPLHRAGAAVARRDRGQPLDRVGSRARGARARGGRLRSGLAQGRRTHGQGPVPRRAHPAATPARRPGGALRGRRPPPACHGHRGDRGPGPASPGHTQRPAALRRGAGARARWPTSTSAGSSAVVATIRVRARAPARARAKPGAKATRTIERRARSWSTGYVAAPR